MNKMVDAKKLGLKSYLFTHCSLTFKQKSGANKITSIHFGVNSLTELWSD